MNIRGKMGTQKSRYQVSFGFNLTRVLVSYSNYPVSITCKVLLGKFIKQLCLSMLMIIFFRGGSTLPGRISAFLKAVSDFLSFKVYTFHEWQPQAPGHTWCLFLKVSFIFENFLISVFFCIVLELLCYSKYRFCLVVYLLPAFCKKSISLVVCKAQSIISARLHNTQALQLP